MDSEKGDEPKPELVFHPTGFYVRKRGAKVTTDEKYAKLCGFPFYAEDAIGALWERELRGVATPDSATAEELAERAILEVATKLTERQINFFKTLLLAAEKRVQKHTAEMLKDMKSKDRQAWIERKVNES